MYTISIDSCLNANRSRVIRVDIERLLICSSSSNLFVFERATRPRFVSPVFATFFPIFRLAIDQFAKNNVAENLFFNNIRLNEIISLYFPKKIYIQSVCTGCVDRVKRGKNTRESQARNINYYKPY